MGQRMLLPPHIYIHPISILQQHKVEAILGVSACAYSGYCVSESGGETQLPDKLPVVDVQSKVTIAYQRTAQKQLLTHCANVEPVATPLSARNLTSRALDFEAHPPRPDAYTAVWDRVEGVHACVTHRDVALNWVLAWRSAVLFVLWLLSVAIDGQPCFWKTS